MATRQQQFSTRSFGVANGGIDAENARATFLPNKPPPTAFSTNTLTANAVPVTARSAFSDLSNTTGAGLRSAAPTLVTAVPAGVARRPAAISSTATIGAANRLISNSGVPSAAAGIASSAAAPSSIFNVAPRLSHEVTSIAGDTNMSPRMDRAVRHDPQNVPDLANDICNFWKSIECKKLPSADYMSRQTEINEKMRGILIDWLIEVHYKFKLREETLFLTVNIVDRFLNERLVTKPKLQLVGVTAMLIAAKYEEVYAPEVRDFIYISAKTYTRDEILRMERLILATLNFGLTQPTAHTFMSRWCKAGEVDETTAGLATYISELSLLDYRMLRFKPSLVAAASMYLARKYSQTRGESWTYQMQHYTTFEESEVVEVAALLNEGVKAAPTSKLGSCFKKSSSSRLNSVALVTTRVTVDL